MGILDKTEIDNNIGKFFLWMFATIGFVSTLFWVIVFLVAHHVAVN